LEDGSGAEVTLVQSPSVHDGRPPGLIQTRLTPEDSAILLKESGPKTLAVHTDGLGVWCVF